MPLPPFSDLPDSDCILGETAGDYALASRDDNRRAAALLASQARRTIELFTSDLEPALYDQAPFIDALAQLALSSPRARVRILAKDFERTVKEGHRLVELTRRLSSYVEIRRVHEDYRDNNETFLLVDDYGLLHRRHAARFEGTFSCKAPLEVRRLRAFFDEVWNRSEPDADVRRLHL
ncbi:MAG: hypothetical protein HY941_08140 [Gammaproteobacteria bacterium]|nr:hypothetical protein [Gammaproteobacteria bacterium]